MAIRSLDERAEEYRGVQEFMEAVDGVNGVRINVGMPMEFDPRKGETPKPDGIEFTISEKTDEVLLRISEACEKFGMRVVLPEFKQPNFTFDGRRYNENVDYVAFVRLVDER